VFARSIVSRRKPLTGLKEKSSDPVDLCREIAAFSPFSAAIG
jgi:hypothetical protein